MFHLGCRKKGCVKAGVILWFCVCSRSMRLLNALNSEDRGLKVRFCLATIAFDRESAQMSQILSSQGKNAPSNPYPHYLVRLATSRFVRVCRHLRAFNRVLDPFQKAWNLRLSLFARVCVRLRVQTFAFANTPGPFLMPPFPKNL